MKISKLSNTWFAPRYEDNRVWMIRLGYLGMLAVVLLVLPRTLNLYAVLPVPAYLTVHTIFESASVFISLAIFSVGIISYDRHVSFSALIIAGGFLAAGLVDFFHLMSFPEMPSFITKNTSDKTIYYWLIARFIVAISFVAAVMLVPKKSEYVRSAPIIVGALLAAAGSLVLVTNYSDALPPGFTSTGGLTLFKISAEYAIAALYIAAALGLNWQSWVPPQETRLLQMGLILNAVSEWVFTGYASLFDTVNLEGHVYKIAAYLFFLFALYLANLKEPYVQVSRLSRRLADSHEQLEQKDHLIRNAYADIFQAITSNKLLIMSDEEISSVLGETDGKVFVVSSFEKLADARRFLRETLRRLSLPEDKLSDIILAAGEATTNGVKHAHSCELRVYAVNKTAQILVSDTGPGISFDDLPRATLLSGYSTKQTLGVGFNVMLETCARIRLSTSPRGTTIVLESDDLPTAHGFQNTFSDRQESA